jgi:hypothetical protein
MTLSTEKGMWAAALDYCHDKRHKSAGMLTSKTGECLNRNLKGNERRKEAAKTISQAYEANRSGKLANGDGSKTGCQHVFIVKKFAARS